MTNYLQIDLQNLDEELENLPALIDICGEEYAKAVKNELLAEEDLKRIKAEVELEIRRSGKQVKELYGVDKLTESVVKALIYTDQRVKEAIERYAEAKAETVKAKAKYDAIKQKGSSLYGITQLWLATYYSKDGVSLDEIKKKVKKKFEGRGEEIGNNTSNKWWVEDY